MKRHGTKDKNVFKRAVDNSINDFKRVIGIIPLYRLRFVREVASKRCFPFCEMIDKIQPI